jgi:hypothetical protein
MPIIEPPARPLPPYAAYDFGHGDASLLVVDAFGSVCKPSDAIKPEDNLSWNSGE